MHETSGHQTQAAEIILTLQVFVAIVAAIVLGTRSQACPGYEAAW